MGLAEREEKRSSVVGQMINIPVDAGKKVKTGRAGKNDPKLIQRGYYLTPELAKEVKIRAVMEGKNDYEIVMEALERFLR